MIKICFFSVTWKITFLFRVPKKKRWSVIFGYPKKRKETFLFRFRVPGNITEPLEIWETKKSFPVSLLTWVFHFFPPSYLFPLFGVFCATPPSRATYESFSDSPTCLAHSPQGWKDKASNHISELILPLAGHQWPKTWLPFEVQVETRTRRSLDVR